jgi:hypothetical protein
LLLGTLLALDWLAVEAAARVERWYGLVLPASALATATALVLASGWAGLATAWLPLVVIASALAALLLGYLSDHRSPLPSVDLTWPSAHGIATFLLWFIGTLWALWALVVGPSPHAAGLAAMLALASLVAVLAVARRTSAGPLGVLISAPGPYSPSVPQSAPGWWLPWSVGLVASLEGVAFSRYQELTNRS